MEFQSINTAHHTISTVTHALSLVRKDSFASLSITIAAYCGRSESLLALQDVLDLAWPKCMRGTVLHSVTQQQ